jgi:hypothetical protein
MNTSMTRLLNKTEQTLSKRLKPKVQIKKSFPASPVEKEAKFEEIIVKNEVTIEPGIKSDRKVKNYIFNNRLQNMLD